MHGFDTKPLRVLRENLKEIRKREQIKTYSAECSVKGTIV